LFFTGVQGPTVVDKSSCNGQGEEGKGVWRFLILEQAMPSLEKKESYAKLRQGHAKGHKELAISESEELFHIF
jgi:hypothetical protein